MEKPHDWPTSPIFLDSSPDGCRRQLAFYERAYGHVPEEQQTARVKTHMEYARYMLMPAGQRIGKQTDNKGFDQLLLDLDGI